MRFAHRDFVGLTYAFGATSKRAANNFDFGAKAPGDPWPA
jgi:hypothetical protein